MALINCKHCGGVVSEKATVCPHCGKDPHEVEVTNATVTEEVGNSKLTVCPHCGGTVSRKATVCPHCGAAVSAGTTSADAVATAGVASVKTDSPMVKQPEVTDTGDGENTLHEEPSSRNLKIVLGVVGLIIVVFIVALLLFKGAFKKNDSNACYADTDTVAIADSAVADTIYTSAGMDEVAADTASLEDALSNDAAVESGQISDAEYGFRNDADVRQFLAGRTYYCDDKAMKITSQGIYVNGNDISTSYPEFTQVSGNVGRVTANPSVSITVRRDENILIDNHSGERYYLSE